MARTHTAGLEPVPVAAEDNLTTTLWRRGAEPGGRDIVRYHADGAWRGLTWHQLAQQVEAVAAGLIASGVQPGDRVALVSGTRLEWTIADLAILAAGAVSVPLYETSSAEQCSWVLSDSGSRLVLAATAEIAKTLEQARDAVPDLGEVLVFDDGALETLRDRAGEEHRRQVAERVAATSTADLASLIYTSGTTGVPKGCILTHGNLLSMARQVNLHLPEMFAGDASTLLFLPLAHVFARIIQFGCLEAEAQIIYARGVDVLLEDLAATQPTFLLAVPRVFEKVYNGAQRKATGAKAKVFRAAVEVGRRWSEATDAGRRPSLPVRVGHAIADRLVFSKLRAALGGRVQYAVSGGAPLAPHLAHFFNAAGVIILEGYGLTETSAATTVNRVSKRRIGTVGLPLPGVEVSLADDGELLVRGPGNFQGYWNDEESTRMVRQPDGVIRTGDLGEIDDDGFVRITGRKKDIIITAGGKNVAPAPLEERLKANRLISQAIVVGDRRPFIAALVTLDPEELAAFAEERGLSADDGPLTQAPAVQAEIQRAVDHANRLVSRAESIRKVRILDEELTQENGGLTPKMSVRRNAVLERLADEVDALYSA